MVAEWQEALLLGLPSPKVPEGLLLFELLEDTREPLLVALLQKPVCFIDHQVPSIATRWARLRVAMLVPSKSHVELQSKTSLVMYNVRHSHPYLKCLRVKPGVPCR